MAFYSTFTYLGMGVISGIYSLLPPSTLPVLLFVFIVPSFVFLYLLNRELKLNNMYILFYGYLTKFFDFFA
jgi:hypothetical protein